MITLDFETRSFAELAGKKGVGTWAYSQHPTTAVLCMAYKIDDGPTEIWAPWKTRLGVLRTVETDKGCCLYDEEGYEGQQRLMGRIIEGDMIVAHNSFFERAVWENVLSRVPLFGVIPRPDQWVCTMAMARANGLPGGLDLTVKTLGLPVEKGNQKWMRRMMKPRAAWKRNGKGDVWFGTEEDYQGLCEYCILDVDVEYQLYHALKKLSPRERRIWKLDQEINHRGVRIDRKLAEGAWSVFSDRRDRKAGRLGEITGGDVTAPSQTAKLVTWVRSQGASMADCTAETVRDLLGQDNLDSRIREVLEIRSAVGGAAANKYESFLRHASADDRLRGELQYWGAHTGRWTASGSQLHNAVKNKMPVGEADARKKAAAGGWDMAWMWAEFYIPCFYESSPDRILAALRERGLPPDKLDALIATLVRAVLIPDDGKIFVDFDYSQIEARVIAWLAGETELIEAFERDLPIYEQMAAKIFGIPLEAVTKEQRALGKVAILGLGYGMGAPKFYDTCISWGVPGVTHELAEKAKTIYRADYGRICQYWYDFEDCVRKAIRTGGPVIHGSKQIEYSGGVLSYTLPNGRRLHYHKCEIVDGSIQYFGRIPPPKSGYGTVYSWGARFAENEDQGLSRDYMALGMMGVNAIPDVDVLLTFHDEVLMQVPEKSVDKLLPVIKNRIMPRPLWARGLPVNVGYWVGPRFRKD